MDVEVRKAASSGVRIWWWERMRTLQGRFDRRSVARGLIPYAMVLPAMSILAIFVVMPIVYMVYLSAFEWNMIGEKTFVGFENFVQMFSNPDFWQVFTNTLIYVCANVTLSIGIALALALYLKRDTRINLMIRSALFAPYIVSLVSISFIWMWMMDSDYGLLNYALGLIGIEGIPWLDSPNYALLSVILVSVWKGIGYNTIIILSSINTIPAYLYEAAALDQASALTRFYRLTLPMISPSLFFLLLMDMIASFKVFETVNIMTRGGPMNATNSLVHSIYEYGFQYYKIGYASAMGVVLMVILGICTLFYFRALSRRVHYR